MANKQSQSSLKEYVDIVATDTLNKGTGTVVPINPV